jgi:hypothetical protein
MVSRTNYILLFMKDSTELSIMKKKRNNAGSAAPHRALVPIVADFFLNLTALTDTINKDIRISIRSVVTALV